MCAIGSDMDHKWANVRVRARDAVQAIAEMFEVNIASGIWQPGARLPTERDLAAQYGLSRNTLRICLDKLEASGRIVRHVGRGAFVAPPSRNATSADPLAHFKQCSPADVMEVRLMLEPRAAELAATRASTTDLKTMIHCLLSAVESSSISDFEHWDGMLHKTIIRAARNELLSSLYETINIVRNQPEWAKLKELTVTIERRQKYQSSHGRIVEALQDRNAQRARDEMQAHLLEVRANLLGDF
jgi:GntR family transcriptional regulator, transcriptional repressor for pyruvate dehydrogenase complex